MKMKAGTYYIGDLCYVLHGEWNEVCKLTLGEGIEFGTFTLEDAREFAFFGTYYGDGEYPIFGVDSLARIGVDSGTVGCILWDSIDHHNDQNDVSLGVKHTFTEDFVIDSNDGIIRFGDVTVDTSGEEGGDEDWNDENQDDSFS